MVDLLILKNRVFRLRNVQIWVVRPWKVTVLLIFTNCFQAAKRSDMDCVELQGVYLLIDMNGIFGLRKVQIRAVPSCKSVDLLILRSSVLTVRNVEIWAALSSNEVDLLMLRNLVFRKRNDD